MVVTRLLLSSLHASRNAIVYQAKRNIGLSAPAFQQANIDPIQQMFVDKIREYASKSKGQSMFEATADQKKALEERLEKLNVIYNVKEGEDMTKFPAFSFKDPSLDPTSHPVTVTEIVQEEEVEEVQDSFFFPNIKL